MRVAVVGAGIHGASAARALSERGHAVTLFDRFPPGHDRGSSHGRSRIVRQAYPDAFYTACMAQAYPLWAELERASGQRLLHEVGLLYFGAGDSPALAGVIDGLRELNVPHEIVRGGEASRLARLNLTPSEIGVFTPEAGWVDAEAALRATLRLALAAGCEIQTGGFPFLAERASESEGAKGLAHSQSFDARVICPGAWVRDFWPAAPVRVTLQATAYVEGEVAGPVWIEDGPDLLYGFPTHGPGFKVGVHRPGPEIDPNTLNRTPPDEFLDLIRDLARRRFGIEDPVLHEARGCLYANTPDEDFRLVRLAPNTYLASACSGHGFKFGPWIGKLLADFVEGRDAPEHHPRFTRP